MKTALKSAGVAFAMLATAAVSQSQAAPVTVMDTYFGGNDYSFNADVIGSSKFEIFSMVVDRIGNNLKVVINTNYANHVGELGTKLGSLFIGDPSKLNYNTAGGGPGGLSGAPQYNSDVFTADTDRFGYAFDFDTQNPGNLSVLSGTGSLYDLDEDGTDVKLSFASGGFRHNQAVDIYKSDAIDTGVNGIWAIGPGTITFDIAGFFATPGLPAIYQTSLTLAWAMTCANDVILATVQVPRENTPEVPLPASALLLLSGLAGLTSISRMRKRQSNA
jgi:hypothetical protein